MITLHALTNSTQYQQLRYRLIRGAESQELIPYIDPKGVVTIGVGFALNGSDRDSQRKRESVYSALGFKLADVAVNQLAIEAGYMTELTKIFQESWAGYPKDDPEFLSAIDNIMFRRYQDTRLTFDRRRDFAFNNVVDVDGNNIDMMDAFNGSGDEGIAKIYEDRLNAKLGQTLANSNERAALMSLVYHSTNNLNAAFVSAYQEGNRAEAWYQLRFNEKLLTSDNANIVNGIVKRRFWASDVFGLYNDPVAMTSDDRSQEALDIFRMYTQHRTAIDDFWNARTIDEAAMVNIANRDYSTTIVQPLQFELLPAKESLLDWIRTNNGVGLSTDEFGALDFQVGSAAKGTALSGSYGDYRNARNILIGGTGIDYLIGRTKGVRVI